MSDQQDINERMPGRSALEDLLTPKATAIAAFAFAVFSMLGQGTWTQALQGLFWGANYPESMVPWVFSSWALATLLLAGVAWFLARRTLSDVDSRDSWEGHLARAAVLVAAAGGVLSVLGIVGGLIGAA